MSCVLSSKQEPHTSPALTMLSVLSTVTMTSVGKSIWTYAGLLNNAASQACRKSEAPCAMLQYQCWAFEILGK